MADQIELTTGRRTSDLLYDENMPHCRAAAAYFKEGGYRLIVVDAAGHVLLSDEDVERVARRVVALLKGDD